MVTAATIGSKLERVRKGLNLTLSEMSEKTKLAPLGPISD
jgi:cytoskeletal protein RodZ